MWMARHVVRVAWLGLAIGCQERNPAFVGATTGSTGTLDTSTSTSATTTSATTTTTTSSDSSESAAATTTDDSDASGSSTESGIDPACIEDLPPVGSECPAECTGGCARPGTCTIDCAGSCPDEVACPEGFACTINCINGDCQGTTLRCASEHACRINCTGANTCRNATFECGAGTCGVECDSGGNICRDATLQCGTNDSRACGGSSSVTPLPTEGSACACVNEC